MPDVQIPTPRRGESQIADPQPISTPLSPMPPSLQEPSPPAKPNPMRIVLSLLLLAAAVALVAAIASSMSRESAGSRDFIAYWAAGQQLVHGADPYDSAAILSLESAAGLHGDRPNMMLNLPVAFFMALPLGLVSAKTGMILWLILLVACLMASIRILWYLHGRPNDRLHLLGYVFPPVLACIVAGQLGIFLLLGVVLFLYFHQSRPLLAGAALLLCAVKPHLFLPFAVVLLAWLLSRKAYRLLAGICAAIGASCALAFLFDAHAWSQYARMMSQRAEVSQDFVPTLSILFRLLVDRNAAWLQFVPAAAACAWALWYFWTRRARWNWMDQGLLLLLVSEVCAPHAWFTDEVIVLPAVLASLYRADRLDRSLLPFGLIAGIALIEVMAQVTLISVFYVWTAPAWLACYLYATRAKPTPPEEARADAVISG